MNTQPHHYETGGDPAIASCMALWRRIQEMPEVKRALAVTPRKINVRKGPKPPRKKASRITEKEIAEMNRLYYEEKMPLAQVAERVGVSFPCAWIHVRKGKTHTNK